MAFFFMAVTFLQAPRSSDRGERDRHFNFNNVRDKAIPAVVAIRSGGLQTRFTGRIPSPGANVTAPHFAITSGCCVSFARKRDVRGDHRATTLSLRRDDAIAVVRPVLGALFDRVGLTMSLVANLVGLLAHLLSLDTALLARRVFSRARLIAQTIRLLLASILDLFGLDVGLFGGCVALAVGEQREPNAKCGDGDHGAGLGCVVGRHSQSSKHVGRSATRSCNERTVRLFAGSRARDAHSRREIALDRNLRNSGVVLGDPHRYKALGPKELWACFGARFTVAHDAVHRRRRRSILLR